MSWCLGRNGAFTILMLQNLGRHQFYRQDCKWPRNSEIWAIGLCKSAWKPLCFSCLLLLQSTTQWSGGICVWNFCWLLEEWLKSPATFHKGPNPGVRNIMWGCQKMVISQWSNHWTFKRQTSFAVLFLLDGKLKGDLRQCRDDRLTWRWIKPGEGKSNLASQRPKSKGNRETSKMTLESLEIVFHMIHITMQCLWHCTHMCKICVWYWNHFLKDSLHCQNIQGHSFHTLASLVWSAFAPTSVLSLPLWACIRCHKNNTKTKKNLQQNFIWLCLEKKKQSIPHYYHDH